MIWNGLALAAADQKIPDCLLGFQMGPEQYVLIVEKLSQTLYVYSNYKENPVATFKITSGKNGGPKMTEGDMKTPEGLYYFNNTISGDALPKSDDYGEKAFTMNYPNPIDKIENRNGKGIWLHGAFDPKKLSSPFNSRGCVVLDNKDLIEISKYIYLNSTPICIYEKVRYDTIDNMIKKRDQFVNHLREWKSNWESKNIDNYISFYHKSFKYNNMALPQFRAQKEGLNSRYKLIRVFLSDINLYVFKNEYLVYFNQLYISDVAQFYSRKIQYWCEENSFGKIVDEQTFNIPQPQKYEFAKGNFMSIDEYRKTLLKEIQSGAVTPPVAATSSAAGPLSLYPPEICIKNIDVLDTSVTLTVERAASAKNIKVIPLLILENKEKKTYIKTLDGVFIKNGVPQDNSKAIPLDKIETQMLLKKEKNYTPKSATIFLVNQENLTIEIITFILNH